MSSSKSKGRGLSYSLQETNDLLEITRELLLIGKEEWECECISANDVRVEYNFDIPEETTPSGSPEYENVETFDA